MKKLLILTTILTSLCLSACGSSNKAMADAAPAAMAEEAYTTYDYADENYTEDAYAAEAYEDNAIEAESSKMVAGMAASTASSIPTDLENLKLVYSSNMTVETLDFKDTYNKLTELVKKYEGFIESENYYDNSNSDNSYYNNYVIQSDECRIRIPAKNYASFVNESAGLGNIRNRNQNVENITSQYNDNSAQIEILEEHLKYYKNQLALIEEDLFQDRNYNKTISQMIELEDKILETQRELNNYKSAKNSMDSLVSYSTIDLTINEVYVYTEKDRVPETVKKDTFATRVYEACMHSLDNFLSFLEGLLIGLIYFIPYLIVISIIVLIVRLFIKKFKKMAEKIQAKRVAKKEAKLNNTTLDNTNE